jgi:hypothetical protein
LAVIYSELALTREARMEFEHIAADNFTTIPQDALWVACMVYLAAAYALRHGLAEP